MTTHKLVRGRWIFPGPGGDVIKDGAILVQGGEVAAIDNWLFLREKYPDAEVLGSDNMAVLPGLINAHSHSQGISTIQHGFTDLLLESWILSLHGMRNSDPYLEVLLSAAKQLRSGVTTVVDVLTANGEMEEFSNIVGQNLKGYDKSGMRAVTAAGITTQSFIISGIGEDERFIESLPEQTRLYARMMLPEANYINEDEYFEVMEKFLQEYHDHPRVDLWFGPPGPQWVSDAFMKRIAENAERWDTGIQTHVNESIYEMIHGPRFYGKQTVLHLDDLGVLSPRYTIAHGVWLSEAEIDVLAKAGASVSHNPSSNLRLRAGIAPLIGLIEGGVNVALGMDGTTINDDEDMFAEIRLAMRLHRSPDLRLPVLEASDIFKLATVGGAKLVQQENRLGRIATGYKADLVLIDLDDVTWPWISPEADPLEIVLYRASAGDVNTVLVEGEIVLCDGMPTRFDLHEVGRELAERLNAEPAPKAKAEMVSQLLPHFEAWYEKWQIPPLEPWIHYNARH